MRPVISISIPTPYITVAEYSKQSGLPEATIRDMISDGRLVVEKKAKATKKGSRVLINMSHQYLKSLKESGFDISLNSSL
ncbi:regulator [Proteus mirabilis]|uniref:regulator n=1 Tax=Morganellaceae TaxID=1903414 RepID=UPI000C9B62EE|nr:MULTISPECIES: regulator [Morganellaceae]EHF3472308.1 regulator [Proteus mirabilis]ELZ9637293.1 regulator [Proteus mirabilis]MCT0064763.1 regulator [Proteus mirabilis]MDK7222105.1 regulator [Proteus mirabilis]MDK7938482.1 regulator [Proteus mirabilis]